MVSMDTRHLSVISLDVISFSIWPNPHLTKERGKKKKKKWLKMETQKKKTNMSENVEMTD